MAIRNERVRISAHFHEQGSVLRGDAEGFADGFDVEISVDTEEPPEAVALLFQLARRMCFTEKALTENTPIQVKQVLNGKPLIGV